jgi:hypothetical protein
MCVIPHGEPASPRTFALDIAGTKLSRISIYGSKLDGGKVVRLGTVRQGEGAQERLTTKVRDDHRRLVINRVEAEPDFLRGQVAPDDSAGEDVGLYRINLEIPPDAPVCSYLDGRGKIRIVSDHPTLPVLSLDVAFTVTSR